MRMRVKQQQTDLAECLSLILANFLASLLHFGIEEHLPLVPTIRTILIMLVIQTNSFDMHLNWKPNKRPILSSFDC